MISRRNYFLMWSILVNLLFACKKEKSDHEPPVITISSPVENQTFQVNDDVLVKGTITDASSLARASITLLNAQRVPVHTTLPLDVSSNEIEINSSYLLDNIHLETGAYQLCIFASDGKNDAAAYVDIQIIGVPRMLKKILVASRPNTSQTKISEVDTSGMFISYTNFPGDHLEFLVNSYFQELLHCGSFTGNFTGININNMSVVLTVSCVPSSTVPYFTGFYAMNNHYYISFYNEQIRGYDHTGNIIYNAAAMNGYVANHIFINDQHLIAEEQHKLNNDQKLVCYYPTGSIEQSCSLSQDVVSFCERDNTHVMVFGNKAGQGLIQEYDRVANNIWNSYPYSLANGMMNCAVKLDADTYLLAFSNGTICKYVYSSGSVTPYLTGYTAIQLVLDELNNTLYVVEKNKITVCNAQGKPMRTVNSADELVALGLLYNR
ncbi:MAG TPA: hypothetical protein VFF27_03035 [Bacteroidia bacterium]|jgi:uncharacterized protein YfaT (DUF1175 family)|nr:hypothetical protein [Bacteroidia bacterium]